eukprot:TRINITY_DN1277_c0_g1_i2.p1 TRINITY_DN1277_c0_g1~~TRINITY_DN1277_c0_g1_i2.p1  ORF type:complete len:282 (-),score=57.56 TRINITY_DN1277_c0_g1_i2:34-879(-)
MRDRLKAGNDERVPKIERRQLQSYPDRGFVLYNVLTPEECKYFIDETERFGYDELCYRKDYRNNVRLVLRQEELAQLIFERVKPFLDQKVSITLGNVKHFAGDDSAVGQWEATGLNECWRFCRYDRSGHFGPHFDGEFCRNQEERSFYTFMIYLNGGFEGGETNFVGDNQTIFKDPATGCIRAEKENIIESVKPEPGLVLVFQHKTMHEGAALAGDKKYIARSEVMFTRTGERAKLDPKEEEARALFRKASAIEHEDAAAAAEMYRRAFKLSPSLKDFYCS